MANLENNSVPCDSALNKFYCSTPLHNESSKLDRFNFILIILSKITSILATLVLEYSSSITILTTKSMFKKRQIQTVSTLLSMLTIHKEFNKKLFLVEQKKRTPDS